MSGESGEAAYLNYNIIDFEHDPLRLVKHLLSMGFGSVEEIPLHMLDAILITTGLEPSYNFARAIIAHLKASGVQFYAFVPGKEPPLRLLCANSPALNGFAAFQQNVAPFYRGLIPVQ